MVTESAFGGAVKAVPLKTSASQAVNARLKLVLAGGETRTATFYRPYPLAIDSGSGCRIWDVDGNEFIDALNNYSALVHGHGHPALVQAVRTQAERGLVFPAPSPLQAELAERISTRYPSMERVRFTNSGTEAVMLAIRAARAFTGRDLIVKTHGGYHGSWEQVALASTPADPDSLEAAGDGGPARSARWADIGIPEAVRGLVRIVPYNDPSALEKAFERDGDRIAAVIFEPVIGEQGVVASPEFLRAAQEETRRHGALLVLDEVVSARLHYGGMQTGLNCVPDLTTLGKVIGGGLPVGCLGGRVEVMGIFDQSRDAYVPHHGTFNGNLLTMAAGCVSLDLLSQEAIDRLNTLGERLGESLDRAFQEANAPLRAGAIGSLVFLRADRQVLDQFHHYALENGVYLAPRGFLNLSTVMDERDLAEVTQRLTHAAQALTPRTATPIA